MAEKNILQGQGNQSLHVTDYLVQDKPTRSISLPSISSWLLSFKGLVDEENYAQF